MGLLLLVPVLIALKVHLTGRRAPGRLTARDVVVLGALVRPDGSPTDALVDRVKTAAALYRQGLTQRVVLTGGTPDSRPTEASVMAQLAIAGGVDPAALVLEPSARSTADNARLTAALRVDRKILLVTCDFHVARAAAHFRARGFDVVAVPSRRTLRAADRLMVIAREVLALLRRPWLLVR